LSGAKDSTHAKSGSPPPRSQGWKRVVDNVCRERREEPTAKSEKGSPRDWPAISTAAATVLIAIFTVVLAVVSRRQLRELHDSGVQMDRMILLYSQQVNQLSKQAGDTHDLAIAAGKQAKSTSAQLGLTRSQQRPWISPSIRIVKDTETGTGHFRQIDAFINLKNVGGSPARDVGMNFMGSQPIATYRTWRDMNVCADAEKRSNGADPGVDRATVIFPGPDGIDNPVGFHKDLLWIIVCVTYRDMSGSTLHTTRSLFRARSGIGKPIEGAPGIFYPVDSLQLWDSDAN